MQKKSQSEIKNAEELSLHDKTVIDRRKKPILKHMTAEMVTNRRTKVTQSEEQQSDPKSKDE